jgi:hypothetical protein
MHLDAFAADYQEEEYRLIGMAIKFAGICGKGSPRPRTEFGDRPSKQDYTLIRFHVETIASRHRCLAESP